MRTHFSPFVAAAMSRKACFMVGTRESPLL